MSYDTTDADPCDVHHTKVITARKEHTCDACKEPIKPGYHYTRVFLVFEGQVETHKRCMRCQRIHDHLAEKGAPADLYPDERLDCGISYREHWDEDPPEEIAALAFALPADLEIDVRKDRP